MEKKKGFGEAIEAFFAGKGFYIVLFLCVAIIGVSAWVMLTENGTDVDSGEGIALSEAGGQTERAMSQPSSMKPAEAAAETKPEAEAEAEPVAALVPEEPVGEAQITVAEEPKSTPVTDFFVWPTAGEIENDYCMSSLSYNRTMRDWRTHDGLDIACELGAQVKAASGGTVSAIRDDDMLGTMVIIDHGGGLCSGYANLAETPTVSVGDVVTPGQVIGAVGDTALCETGEVTHLHFSMSLDGESIDPTEYMP